MCMCVCDFRVSPEALPSLHCFCKYCCPIHPHMPKHPKMRITSPPPRRPKKERYCRNKSWKNQEHQLKMFNEDSCSCSRYNNNKICMNILCQGRQHRGGRGGYAPPPPSPPPTFLCNKKKKGRQREKRKSFKAETIKKL